MKVLAYKNKDSLRIVVAESLYKGVVIGTTEQIQLSNFTLNPEGTDALALGDMGAAWGLELDPDLNLPGSVVTALGIGKPFRVLSYARRAVVKNGPDGAYLAHPGGGMLNLRGRMVHLYPYAAEYSL